MDEKQLNARFTEIRIRYAYQFRRPLERADAYSIDPGWLSIYANLFAAVDAALIQTEKQHFSWVQLKEKLGGMRAYHSVDREACGDALADAIRAKVRPLVEAAEIAALKTCSVCGEPGELRRGGWIRTLCDAHARERERHDD